jgi:hypothetical protein
MSEIVKARTGEIGVSIGQRVPKIARKTQAGYKYGKDWKNSPS